MVTLFASFCNTGNRLSVSVSLECSHYYVAESSGVVHINIVTSHHYDKDFTAKLSVLLGRHRTNGDYGELKCITHVCL